METFKGKNVFYAESRAAWREWLMKNHESEESVYLKIFKMESKVASVYYPEAVDEVLCFGWIDSVAYKNDDLSYFQFFSKRKAKSNWSAVNKAKVEKLLSEGLIMAAGFKMIELAKQTGTWDALNDVENLIIPNDLAVPLYENEDAKSNWEGFSKSSKRAILEWLLNAKRPETRQNRIQQIVQEAKVGKRANFKNE